MHLDLTIRQFTRPARLGILVIGTWYRDEHLQWKPALVLVKASDERQGRDGAMVPCVIPLDGAWVWSEDIGDPRRAAQTAYQFALALRLADDPMNIVRIAGIINDHLPDLVSIPPLPPSERRERPVAEGIIHNLETDHRAEIEVRA